MSTICVATICNVASCAEPALNSFFHVCAVPLIYVPVPSLNLTKNSCSAPSQYVNTFSYFSAVLLYVKSCAGVSTLSEIYCFIGLSNSVTSIVPPSDPLAGTDLILINFSNFVSPFTYNSVPWSLYATGFSPALKITSYKLYYFHLSLLQISYAFYQHLSQY